MPSQPGSPIANIKRAQRESSFLRAFAGLFRELALDHPSFLQTVVTRASFSRDKSLCTFFFYTPEGPEVFKEHLELLKLYKPSLRTAMGKAVPGRRVPNLRFKFDASREKTERVNRLLDELKQSGQL